MKALPRCGTDAMYAMEEQLCETHLDTSASSSIDDTIIINVGGVRHEVLRETLTRVPGTLLSSIGNVQNHYRHHTNEYFFDRHPQVFAAILNYYRTGELHLPNDVCIGLVKSELQYWEIPATSIESCCWMRYNAHWDQLNTLAQFETKKHTDVQTDTQSMSKCWRTSQPRIWAFLDDPYSTLPAKVFAWVSLLLVLVSIFTFCAETHPYFMVNTTISQYADDQDMSVQELGENLGSTTEGTDTNTTDRGAASDMVDNDHAQSHAEYVLTDTNPYLIKLDYFLYFFFTTELVLRAVFCKDKCAFWRSFLNIVDLMAIVPFYIELIVSSILGKNKKSVLEALLFIRIIRIFRVFRLFRHHRGLQTLLFTIRASMKEILLLVLLLGIGMIIFASLIFYADRGSGNFRSIPHSFWWAIVTMTTVGYGDMVPGTPWGFAVGSLCAVSGVLVIAFTVPVIVNNFLLIYQYMQFKRNHPEMESMGMTHPDRDRWGAQTGSIDSNLHIARGEFAHNTQLGWTTIIDEVPTSDII